MRAEWEKNYPVAMIPYINMLPYRMLGTPPNCCWHDLVPRDSVKALATGKVLAAAVPVGALPGLGDIVEPLGAFGIAARDASMSVLFFSNRPFDQVRATDRLRLTRESATSVRLLYLLLDRYPPLSAEGERHGTGGDDAGALVIGDRALKELSNRRLNGGKTGRLEGDYAGFTHVTDLATRWFQLYRRPFVFARWVIRRDAPQEARNVLREWLEAFRAQEDAMVTRAIPVAAHQLALPEPVVADYYRCLGRVLGDADLEGQNHFLKEIHARSIDRLWEENPAAVDIVPDGPVTFHKDSPAAGRGGAHAMDAGVAV